jgi:hypothetical protein
MMLRRIKVGDRKVTRREFIHANVSVEGKPVRYRRGPAAVIGNGVCSNSRHCPERRVGRLEALMARKPEDLAETTT